MNAEPEFWPHDGVACHPLLSSFAKDWWRSAQVLADGK
jgi:hypothetical protein